MSVPLCYYGFSVPLPPRRVLRAGPLSCVYEAGDLRYVKVGDVEVCRRLYAAVRDENWGTVPGEISEEQVIEVDGVFQVTYTCTHQRGGIHYVWHARIRGDAGGLTFTFDGLAESHFRRNRIGLCVLHPPATCAGQAATLHHPDGTTTATHFPDLIAPQNPFRDLTGLDHELGNGGRVSWRFDGDVFETEDQRNWIDASFKTFCTPLSRPFPVAVTTGERVRQRVTLTVSAPDRSPTRERGGLLTLARASGSKPTVRLPAIGLGVGVDGRGIEPAFCRLDLDLTQPGWADALRAADRDAPLELAVTTSGDAGEIAGLVPVLREVGPTVERLLVVRAGEWATRSEDVLAVAGTFAEAGLTPQQYGGTTANFTELNRRRPPFDLAQGVCYSAQPQEHAFDNASLAECCAALADTVRSARAFCGDRPLSVGPITLRKRVNPYATGPGWQPPPPDPRHRSLFGAGWALAALKYLAESGVESVSFAEPPGLPGWPTWLTVLHDLKGRIGDKVIPLQSSDPLRFDGLMIRRGGRVRVLLTNLTPDPVEVTVSGLPSSVVIDVLDEYSFDPTPDGPPVRGVPTTRAGAPEGRLTLTLRPYAYVRIDRQ